MSRSVLVSRFEVGQVVITQGAASEVRSDEVFRGLVRHMSEDWGELEEFDWKQNDAAVEYGGRILSRYISSDGVTFWIITECDRTLTTILLPAEY